MRSMSFALTTDQVRARTKTVTRRLGWTFLKAGDRIRAVVRCHGKGELMREGFDMLPHSFASFFMESHRGCTLDSEVTRIEFAYEDDVAIGRSS
jgi:hypothetical protein